MMCSLFSSHPHSLKSIRCWWICLRWPPLNRHHVGWALVDSPVPCMPWTFYWNGSAVVPSPQPPPLPPASPSNRRCVKSISARTAHGPASSTRISTTRSLTVSSLRRRWTVCSV
ncbi:unnamed protein product [Schistocephalus solidus]|uniref:Uncharacterized protein n=1 Tax=Schistocephalus solidus TaxID=70667 RepID=A0A3P7DJD2_SCHSO|nr:unnamed protein product [Schistocephalus solidus]